MSRTALAAIVVLVVALGGLSACAATTGAGTVTVLGTWTGAEQESFERVLAAFERETGIDVQYTGTPDAANVLRSDIKNGHPPDLAAMSTPYELNQYAAKGKLVGLTEVLDVPRIEADYGEQWLRLMRANTNSYHAVIVKAAPKSLIWYNPKSFKASGYGIPATWAQLMTLGNQATAAGGSLWCLGVESTPASGWPGTDWIEDILLHQSGPAVYQQWADGTLPWTSPQVTQAWQAWGQIVATPKTVYGGGHGALLTNFGDAGRPMLANPPGCLLDHEGSFITGFYAKYAAAPQPGTDFAFFGFPAITPEYAHAQEVSADLLGMFRDTPQARQLVRFLTTSQAQSIWPAQVGSGAFSVDRTVPASVYGDNPVWTALAGVLTDKGSDTTFSFDASDQMPAAMQAAFYQAVLRFLANPAELPAILADLDRVRGQA
jgi:alpha-glucoside transport system substrate-binding protein